MDIQEIFNSGNHFVSKNKYGKIDTVLVNEKVTLETSVGNLIPRYTMEEGGRRKEAPVKFYRTGELKSLPLEEATEINTSVGTIKSELVIFHQNGALLRTFPLNGQVTGFWTEKNEFALAETIEIPSSLGTIKVKPIYLQFYETGELESILFWPVEKVELETPVGKARIRKGICFYKNGTVKGFEPAQKISVESPIGTLTAFDPDPNGIQAENHAINFNEDGSIQCIITPSNQVITYKDGVESQRFAPKMVTSYCNENNFFVNPLKITFGDDSISFMNINESEVTLPKSLEFKVEEFNPRKPVSEVGCG